MTCEILARSLQWRVSTIIDKVNRSGLTIFKFRAKDDGFAAGSVDAVQERLVTKIRVDQSRDEAGLAETQPGTDVLRTALHNQSYAVIARKCPRAEVTSYTITELLQLCATRT